MKSVKPYYSDCIYIYITPINPDSPEPNIGLLEGTLINKLT